MEQADNVLLTSIILWVLIEGHSFRFNKTMSADTVFLFFLQLNSLLSTSVLHLFLLLPPACGPQQIRKQLVVMNTKRDFHLTELTKKVTNTV